MPVIVQSSRDQRVLAWLIEQVGEDAVAIACCQLAGSCRPYVSNLANALGLKPPAQLALASEKDARQHIEMLFYILQRRNCI